MSTDPFDPFGQNERTMIRPQPGGRRAPARPGIDGAPDRCGAPARRLMMALSDQTTDATRGEGVPLAEGFGLAQHERLRAANVAAYRAALDRLFLPRLIYRLEQLLEKNIGDTAFVYEG